MLKKLVTQNVGPAERFELDFGDRLTVITGDNGLGKSFLLEMGWAVCTRDWVANDVTANSIPTVPRPLKPGEGLGGMMFNSPPYHWFIEGTFCINSAENSEPVILFFREGHWKCAPNGGGPGKPTGLLIYTRVDGGVSVWDPIRGDLGRVFRPGARLDPEWPISYHFSRREIWHGLKDERQETICRGLIIDWPDWQVRRPKLFSALENVIALLAPKDEPIRIAKDTVRLPGRSADHLPALDLRYGKVPVTLASAGMQRILALAYLILWLWDEHKEAAKANGVVPQNQIVVFIDEVEAHLHPLWQRYILPRLLEIAGLLDVGVHVQFVVTTHSPLVLASLEPEFDEARDALYHLRQEDGAVKLERMDWEKQGTASEWLLSDVFGLDDERSLQASAAIRAADGLMLPGSVPTAEQISAVEADLKRLLPSLDAYWVKWHRFKMTRGKAS